MSANREPAQSFESSIHARIRQCQLLYDPHDSSGRKKYERSDFVARIPIPARSKILSLV